MLVWVVVALVLDLVTMVITVGVNVPANNRLKAVGEADDIDGRRRRGRSSTSVGGCGGTSCA